MSDEVKKVKGYKGYDGIYCSDLESTGLLHDLILQGDKAKLHNFCAMEVNQDKMYLLHTNTKEQRASIQRFLDRDIVLVMHSGIGYDYHALKHFGYDVSKVTVVDTLALSWYLDLYRPKHGLLTYGIEAKISKPEIEDWESLTQKDYDHRVKEDVRIQSYTYDKLKKRFEELYGKMTDIEFCNHKVVRYLNFKMEQLAEQQNTKIKIDVERTKKHIETFSTELEIKMTALAEVMPKVAKYRTHKPPKKPYKNDGTLSATGEKWKELTNEHGYSFEYEGEIKTISKYEDPKPSSPQQVKNWLYSLGWQPETFKYEKKDGKERKIEQVYIPKSGGKICPSIERLAEEVPEVQHLVGVGVISHRIGVLNGFLDSLIFDEYVEAGAAGFTNTLRLKHVKPITNLPSSKVVGGMEVRSCMVARDGMVLCGADLYSLESNIKFNLQLPYDRKGVESQLADDYDPHLALALEAGLLTEPEFYFYKIEKDGFPVSNYPVSKGLSDLLSLSKIEKGAVIKRLSDVRAVGKGGVYSLQYGAFPKTVSRAAKVSMQVAQKLFDAHNRLNWSLEKIGDSHETKRTSFGTYQKNKFNGMWYFLKYAKDSVSTGIQGSGSYVLDLWIANIFLLRDKPEYYCGGKGVKLLASIHDEVIMELEIGYEEVVRKLLDDALALTNKRLDVEIEFSCDTQFGSDYSQIH